ncbi:hypothetical protein Tco_1532808 [Tanacetum coccineum]
MSNSNTNLQTQSSNALHNAIMEAGSKDRPPMLAPGNYVQWKSRIKRYIDTKPNSELIHYSLQNPPYIYQWAEKTVPVAEGSSETTTERYMENYKNVSQDIRDQMNAEAEAVQIILTGIDNDIYSTVDACPNACEMWKAIERLKQGESINVQDLETNLYWEFGKFTSRDGESLESYYSRFYKMMNELVRNQCNVTNHQVNVQFLLQLQPEWQRFVTLVKQSQELKTVSYHKLYDILKQHQNEVNEIRTERLARTANPLALVAQQQPVYHPPNHPTQNTQYSSTRSQQSTRNRGKAIVTSSAPTYDPEPATVTEDDEMSKEKEIDKLMALISLSFKKIYKPTNNNLRTSSNTSRANQENSLRINRGTGYDHQRAVNVAGARENVGTPVVQKSEIQCYNYKEYGHLADWKDDTDDESEEQELEAHYMYMAQIQEVTPDPVDKSGPIFDDEPMHKVQNNQIQIPICKLNHRMLFIMLSWKRVAKIVHQFDACPNACEMWKAIERLKQGESINVQDLETNLYWEFGKFTSRDGESLESYNSQFYKMMNELSQELKTVSYHKLYDILKQHQNEVNKIRAERLARTANPLALVAQQQPVYHHQNHPTQNTQYSSTRSQQSIRNKGKVIVTSSAPTYDPEPLLMIQNLLRLIVNRDHQRAVNVAGARENVENQNRVKDAAYHKEKMLLCKQEKLVQLNAEQADMEGYTDDSSEEQDWKHNICYMAQLQETQDDQDETDDLDQEHDFLASLIQKLKCEIDDSKNRNNFLESPQTRTLINYHSIKDDIPLVSVYTTRDVRVRGMLISDAFLTEEIRATDDFKEYETVFMTVDVPMNQPQPVVSTQGTHRSTPSTHRTPTLIASPQGKKWKQNVGESSSPHKL